MHIIRFVLVTLNVKLSRLFILNNIKISIKFLVLIIITRDGLN